MAGTRTHPTIFGDDHGDRFVHDGDADAGFLCFFEQRSTRIAEFFRIRFDFLDQQTFEHAVVVEQFIQAHQFFAQAHQFLLDFDRLQSRQLTQADFQNILGLTFGQAKSFNQSRFRFVRFADDGDHFVDIEQDDFASFEDMNAIGYLLHTELRATRHGLTTKIDPLGQYLAQRFLTRTTVAPHHHQIQGYRSL